MSTLSIGPFHPMLPGPFKIELDLEGELVESIDIETGYLHRGIEKIFEARNWEINLPFADRIDGESSIFAEIAYCMAIEEICAIEVPLRAKQIRILLSELSRISAHLGYLARVAASIQYELLMHLSLRNRETSLDLFELISGARFMPNYLRIGGLKSDISEGFIERLLSYCGSLKLRMQEINVLLNSNYTWWDRSRGVGVISAHTCKFLGITGPNGRASGVQFDVRKAHPYTGYQNIDLAQSQSFELEKAEGDCFDRVRMRCLEIEQSVEIIRLVAEALGSDPIPPAILTMGQFKVPQGEAYTRVESPRGLLGCYVLSRGESMPTRVQFQTPSSAVMNGLGEILKGNHFDDLPLILASLQINVSEVDR